MKEKLNTLIGWLSTILKIDLHYVVKGGFWLTTKQVSISFFSLITTLVLAHYLTQEDFGTYKYIISFFSLLCLFTATGVFTSIIQWVANKSTIHLKHIVYTRIKYGFVGLVFGFAIAIYYYIRGNQDLSLSFAIISIFVPFFEPFGTYEAILMGKKEFSFSAKIQTIIQSTIFVAVVASTYFTQNIFYIIVAYFVSTTLCKFIALKYVVTHIHTLEESTPTKDILNYGKHLSLIDALNNIAKYIDKIIIFNFIGSQDLAIYTMATTPPEYISTFLQNSQYLTLSKISEQPEKHRNLKRKIVIFITISILISLIYIAMAPLLYRWVLPNYSASIHLSQIYALSIFTIGLVIPLSLLQARKKVNKMYNYNIATALSSIVILLVSVQWGILGVVCGRITIKLLNFFYSLVLLSSENKEDITSAGTP